MNARQRTHNENDYLLALWHKSRAGDKAAFCQLADVQYRSLFSYATNFTNDREFIKDSIQDIFIRIWEKRTTISIQFVSVYLFKSLRNELFQAFRQSRQLLVPLYNQDLSQLSDWQTVETEIERSEVDLESHNRVRRAIGSLSKRQQEVVFLKFYKAMENDQIAVLMDINRQSVANLLCKALCSLKNQMPFLNYLVITIVVLLKG